MSTPEAKQHPKPVRFRTTFGAGSTKDPSQIGCHTGLPALLLGSNCYTNRSATRSWRQLCRRVRPLALRKPVFAPRIGRNQRRGIVRLVCRFSAVASACAGSYGTADAAVRRDSDWTAESTLNGKQLVIDVSGPTDADEFGGDRLARMRGPGARPTGAAAEVRRTPPIFRTIGGGATRSMRCDALTGQ